MTRDVLVKISGLQFENDQEEPLEITTVGQYFLKNEKHYVLFEEILEGEKETCKNRIKIDDNQVEITKTGSVNVHMVFEENKKNLTYYHTPFGNLLIGLETRKIELCEEDSQILLNIQYGLDVNYAHVSDCNIEIKVIQKKEVC